MKKIFLFILLFVGGIASGQIISASSNYRVRASGCAKLLDTYTGATAAYSLRLLDCQYAGSAIRVRRSSDNTEQDIGFTTGGDLDTASMKTFVGTGGTDDGFITTWYDQSGNANDATQATAANQPRIMNDGVIHRLNGKPAFFCNTQSFFNSNNMSGKSVLDIYFILNADNTYTHFYSTNNGTEYGFVAQNSDASTNIYGNFGTPSLYVNNSIFSGTTRNDVYDILYGGAKIIVIQAAATTASSNWGGLFKMFGYSPGFGVEGYCQELIFWDSNQSSNRSNIVTSINSFYSVY